MSLTSAMILAAGLGQRMRPLTEHTPKPLLQVHGKPLIAWSLERLAQAGFEQVVVNTGRLGHQFEEQLGDGSTFGLQIRFLHEGDAPLETAGGIINALPLLEPGPFAVINGDLWCDFPLQQLPPEPDGLAHLVLVDNPAQHADGDFALEQNRVALEHGTRLTFSGIAVYRRELFDQLEPGPRPLAPLLRHAISQGLVSGEHYQGDWADIGTPQRLAALQFRLGN